MSNPLTRFVSQLAAWTFISQSNLHVIICETNLEKASVLSLYSGFHVIKLSEYEKALGLICEAESYCPNEIIIQPKIVL